MYLGDVTSVGSSHGWSTWGVETLETPGAAAAELHTAAHEAPSASPLAVSHQPAY